MRTRYLLSCATWTVAVGLVVPLNAQHTTSDTPDMLPAQVLLDRAGFSPGEIDGCGGPNTKRAIEAFERENNTTLAETLGAATAPPTMTYTITAEDAATPTVSSIPDDMMEKARLNRLAGSTSVSPTTAFTARRSPGPWATPRHMAVCA